MSAVSRANKAVIAPRIWMVLVLASACNANPRVLYGVLT